MPQLLLSRHVQVNTEMVQRVLQEAATAAGELHESELRAVLSQGGVGQGTMDAQHRAATRAARRAFKDQASSIAGEPSFQAYAALADQLMESNAAKLTAENKKANARRRVVQGGEEERIDCVYTGPVFVCEHIFRGGGEDSCASCLGGHVLMPWDLTI